MTKLALMKKFDAILIESTGVSEPQQVAETFTMPIDLSTEEEEANNDNKEEDRELSEAFQILKEAQAQMGGVAPDSLNQLAKLDTCVTVVDCR